jgi:flagellar motor switch protein FliG
MLGTKNKEKDYKKVARLAIALGPEQAKDLMKYLSEDEVKKVITEIFEMDELALDEKQSIINDFTLSIVESNSTTKGGVTYAKELLSSIYDNKKADEIMSYLKPDEGPFKFIENIESEEVSLALAAEHPQTIAVVMALLNPVKSAEIMQFFNKDLRSDVARRIGVIENTEPDTEMIAELISILKDKFNPKKEIKIKGLEKLVKILQQIDKKQQKEIIDELEKVDPVTAAYIKKELFRFEDLKNLEDKYMQRILREVEGKELVIALKGTSDEIKEKIYKNMSERGAEMVKEDMESLGPLKRQIVDDAQQKILSVVRKLEASGEIVMEGGANSDVVI